MYIYTHMCVYIYIQLYIYVYMYVHVYMYFYKRIYIYTCIFPLYTYIIICMCTYVQKFNEYMGDFYRCIDI